MKILSRTNLFLSIIIIVASLLRFYNLTAIALWHDEAFSALLIRYPLGEMMHRIALDVHPPLYYLALRVWDFILGDGLLSLRFFSAFFGILTICFAYLFIRDGFKNEKFALIAAALIAFNPFQIQYSVESRMYTFGAFLIVLSSWLLIKALETPSFQAIAKNSTKKIIFPIKKYKWFNIIYRSYSQIAHHKWWIFYGLSAIAAIYTHYYLIFSVAGQGLFILFIAWKKYNKNIAAWIKGEITRGAIFAYSIAFLLFIPWIGAFLKQLGQVEENYWIPKMSASSIPNTLWRMLSGSNVNFNPNTHNAIIGIISVIFIAMLIIAIKRESSKYKWLIIFSFLAPFLLAIGLSFKRSLYLDRYFVFAGIFYVMIFALFINSIYNSLGQNIRNKRAQAAIFAFFILISFGLFIQNWRIISPAGKTGMAGASKYIFASAAPDEKVYVASTFIFFTYKYYAYQNYYQGDYPSDFNPSAMITENNVFAGQRLYPEYLTPLLYTPGLTALSQIPHFSGAALLTDYDLLTDFNKNIKRGESVWILWTTGFGGSKPEIPQNWTQMDEAGFQDVFDYRGWIVATKYRAQ